MIRPRKRKNETDKQFIIRATKEYHDHGLHIIEIADRLKRPVEEIYNIIMGDRTKCRVVTEEVRDEMIDMRNSGMTLDEIAKITGHSRQTISNRIKEAPKLSMCDCVEMDDVDIDYIKNAYKAGHTVADIGRHLHIGHSSVIYRLKQMGIYTVKSNIRYVTKKDVAKFKRLYNAGYSYRAIGKKCHRNHTTVKKYITGELIPKV